MKNGQRAGRRRFAMCLIIGTLLIGACTNPAGDSPDPGPTPDYAAQLAEKIAEAEYKLSGYKKSADGSEVFESQWWLEEADWDALAAAIGTAKGVRDNAAATAANRKTAIDDLDAALAAADSVKAQGSRQLDAETLLTLIGQVKSELAGVKQSADGVDILTSEKWITPEAFTALQAAVDAAEAVLDNLASTQTDIDTALNSLNAARLANYVPQDGTSAADKTALIAKIAEAAPVLDTALPSDAGDGSDISARDQWVSRTIYDALDNAITAAITTVATADATADAVAAALADLTAAMTAFVPAQGQAIPKPRYASAATVTATPDDEYTYSVALTLDCPVVVAAGGDAKNGFTIIIDDTADDTANGTAAVIDSAALDAGTGDTITFTLAEPYPVKLNSIVTIAYVSASGSIQSAEFAGTLAEDFSGKEVSNTLAVETPIHPWIKTAAVAAGNASQIELVFSEPVRLDASKFVVKVNDKPAVRIGTYADNNRPLLDLSKNAADRTVSAATAGAGGTSYHTNWTLTVSDAANYGEILRLAATAPDAYVDRGGNGLPPPAETPADQQPMSQFIVRNMVARSGALAFTGGGTAGFYVNGAAVGGFTPTSDDQLYKEAITWLTTSTNVTDGDVFTIVLGADQTYVVSTTFTSTQAPVDTTVPASGVLYPDKRFTIVLASVDATEKVITVTGTTIAATEAATKAGLAIRNGITLIIGSGVAFEHANGGDISGTASGFPLIIVADGGKLILDGGEIRKNYSLVGSANASSSGTNAPSAGGVLMLANDLPSTNEAGHSGEAYFIMNSGKITGNTLKVKSRGVSGGGIAMRRNTFLVMNGGEVSNNTLTYDSTGITGNPPMSHAGGIAGFANPAAGFTRKDSNRQGVYITGGAITGNKLEGTAHASQNNKITAAGVVLTGTFQKTGGTINSNINELDATVSSLHRSNGIVVWRMFQDATTIDDVVYRDNAADENVMLFVEGFRTETSANSSVSSPPVSHFGFTAKSSFVPSYGTAPSLSPNGWEN